LSTGKFANAKDVSLATKPYIYTYDNKVEPHHAIVPTSVLPSGFGSKDMETAWAIVATRFLMSLMPVYKYTETVLSIIEEKLTFSAKGEVPLTNPAKTWLALSAEQRKATTVPGIKDKTSGVIKSVKVIDKKTSSPEYYTEATLEEDMRSVAKFVTNEKLKAILKVNSGIGTVATQSAIVGRIQQQGYVKKDGQHLKDTPFGRSLILNLPAQLKDPCLTAAWEDALKMIENGEYNPDEFMSRIGIFIDARLKEIVSLNGSIILSADKTVKTSRGKTKGPTAKPAVKKTTRTQSQPKQKSSPSATDARTKALLEF